jgi:predicted dehydrogenase
MGTRTNPLSIALVGAGAMGHLHARVISQSLVADLGLVIDPDEERGRRLAERYESSWHADGDALEECDAVIVASPTDTHYDWAIGALELGMPTLVEKPMSADFKQSADIVALADSRDLPLTCGFVERFNIAVLTALDVIEEPRYIRSTRHGPYAARVRTGVAQDLLIHDADLALRFANAPVSEVSATYGYVNPESAPGAEDIAEATVSFESGAVASLSANRVSQRKVRELLVSSLSTLVEIDLLRRDVTVYRHVLNSPLEQDGPGYRQETIIDIPALRYGKEPLAAQLDHFVDLVEGRHDIARERSTLLAAHAIVDTSNRAAMSGGRELPPI